MVWLPCTAELRLRLLQLRLRGFQGGFAALQFGAADEILVFQRLVALEIGGGQVAVGGGGGDLRARSIGGQPVILRIELGQHLPGLDMLAEFGLALDELAADPKTQPRLDLRADFTGVFVAEGIGAGADGHDLHGANRLLGRRGPGTGSQQQGDARQGHNGFIHDDLMGKEKFGQTRIRHLAGQRRHTVTD